MRLLIKFDIHFVYKEKKKCVQNKNVEYVFD